jgi:hypothetical protein
MKKKILFCALAVAIGVGVLASAHVYTIVDSGEGVLFWNADEAYVPINMVTDGYRMTGLQYLGEIVRELLYSVREPSNERFYTIVLRITSSGDVEESLSSGVHLGEYNVIDGKIYGYGLGDGAPWRLDGTSFSTLSSEEKSSGHFRATLPPPDYDNMGGWSKRCCFFSREALHSYPIELKGRMLTLMARRIDLGNDISIDLAPLGQPAKTVWHFNGSSRRVSRVDYDKIFANP